MRGQKKKTREGVQMTMEQLLYNVEEAAKLLNIKVSKLRSAIFKKEITHIKLKRLIRFTPAHLEEWIQRSEVKRQG